MPRVWAGIRRAETALAGAIELFALRARTEESRMLRGNDVTTLFAHKASPQAEHDLELVPVNTVRTAYRIFHLGPLSLFLRFLATAVRFFAAALEDLRAIGRWEKNPDAHPAHIRLHFAHLTLNADVSSSSVSSLPPFSSWPRPLMLSWRFPCGLRT